MRLQSWGNDLHVLEDLLGLGVVGRLDLLVVDEVFHGSRMFVDLESLLVDGELHLMAGNVVNSNAVDI